MQKTLLITAVWMILIPCHSQEIVYERNLDSKSGIHDQFLITKDEGYSFFVVGANHIYLDELNSSYQSIEKHKVKRPVNFDVVLGFERQADHYVFYFAKSKTRRLAYAKFGLDTEDHTRKVKGWKFNKKDEAVLKAFQYKQAFHLLTVSQTTSELNLYKFENGLLADQTEFDFSDYFNGLYNNLYRSIADGTGGFSPALIRPQEGQVPLELAADETKLYLMGDQLILTLDNAIDKTVILTLNLANLTSTIKDVAQGPSSCAESEGTFTNSYLLDNTLAQVAMCSKGVSLHFKQLDHGQTVRSYTSEWSDIDFRNTDILEKSYTRKSQAKTYTKPMFPRILEGRFGVVANRIDDQWTVTIGSYSPLVVHKRKLVPFAEQPQFRDSKVPSPNKVLKQTDMPKKFEYDNAFERALGASWVRCSGLFDARSFEHVEGEAGQLVFDRFTDDEFRNNKLQFLAQVSGGLLYGYLLEKDEKYYIAKFEE